MRTHDSLLTIALALLITSAGCGGKPAEVCSRPCAGNPVNQSLIGMTVPSMELDAFHKGQITRIKLDSYRGKWLILFFYPADFTFVCPTELVAMGELYEKFRKAGADVASVSTDSAWVHRGWAEQHEGVRGLPYPMLSDRSGRLCRALGTYVEERGLSVRASFVIDPEGKVVAYEVHDESIGRSASELLRKLQAAVAVRGSRGDFCPASWEPGEEMIHPK